MKMKKIARVLIALALFATAAITGNARSSIAVQTEDKFTRHKQGEVTAELRNGRYWQSLSEAEKTAFLTGFGERNLFEKLRGAKKDKGETKSFGFPKGTKIAEIQNQMDAFYKDKANLVIPVIDAFMAILMKANGMKDQDLNDTLASLRKMYNP